MDLFRQLNREDGITIIVVTHDAEIARHARRVVVLRDGNVLCDTLDVDLAASAAQLRRGQPVKPFLVWSNAPHRHERAGT